MRRIAPAMLATVVLAGAGCDGAAKEQPIPFNHKLHVTKASAPCETCHEHAADRAHAGLPALEVCMQCHKRITPQSPQGAAYVETMRRMFKEGTDVLWARVYELPRHVYFSHQRHTELGGLECKTCHGDMAAASVPPARPIATTLQMSNCIACHEAKGITNDCAACHR
jgi:hypothetical protein